MTYQVACGLVSLGGRVALVCGQPRGTRSVVFEEVEWDRFRRSVLSGNVVGVLWPLLKNREGGG